MEWLQLQSAAHFVAIGVFSVDRSITRTTKSVMNRGGQRLEAYRHCRYVAYKSMSLPAAAAATVLWPKTLGSRSVHRWKSMKPLKVRDRIDEK